MVRQPLRQRRRRGRSGHRRPDRDGAGEPRPSPDQRRARQEPDRVLGSRLLGADRPDDRGLDAGHDRVGADGRGAGVRGGGGAGARRHRRRPADGRHARPEAGRRGQEDRRRQEEEGRRRGAGGGAGDERDRHRDRPAPEGHGGACGGQGGGGYEACGSDGIRGPAPAAPGHVDGRRDAGRAGDGSQSQDRLGRGRDAGTLRARLRRGVLRRRQCRPSGVLQPGDAEHALHPRRERRSDARRGDRHRVRGGDPLDPVDRRQVVAGAAELVRRAVGAGGGGQLLRAAGHGRGPGGGGVCGGCPERRPQRQRGPHHASVGHGADRRRGHGQPHPRRDHDPVQDGACAGPAWPRAGTDGPAWPSGGYGPEGLRRDVEARAGGPSPDRDGRASARGPAGHCRLPACRGGGQAPRPARPQWCDASASSGPCGPSCAVRTRSGASHRCASGRSGCRSGGGRIGHDRRRGCRRRDARLQGDGQPRREQHPGVGQEVRQGQADLPDHGGDGARPGVAVRGGPRDRAQAPAGDVRRVRAGVPVDVGSRPQARQRHRPQAREGDRAVRRCAGLGRRQPRQVEDAPHQVAPTRHRGRGWPDVVRELQPCDP